MTEPNIHAKEAIERLSLASYLPIGWKDIIAEACEATAAEAVKGVAAERDALRVEYESRVFYIQQLQQITGYNNDDGFHSTPDPLQIVMNLKQRAESAELKLLQQNETYLNHINAYGQLQGEKESAEQLVLEMREALEKIESHHNETDDWRQIATEALSLSTPTAGKWLPVEDVRPLVNMLDGFIEQDSSAVENFLAKHGGKLDNIEARRPPAHVDDGRIRPERD